MKEFPVLNYDGKATEAVKVDVKKGKTVKISLAFSNRNCPAVELAPVLRAVFDTKASGWQYKFVTDDIVFHGGLNCIKDLRIQDTNPLYVDLYVRASEDAAPLSIDIEAMSNVSNTASKKTIGRLTLTP